MSAQPAIPDPAEPHTPVGADESVPSHLRPVPDTPPPADVTQHQSAPEPPVSDTADEQVVDDAEPGVVAWRDRGLDVLDQARDLVQPPDLWHQDRPALQRVYYYVRYTEQLPPTGFARVAAIGHSGLAVATHAVAYTAAWVTERPARTAVFAVVLTLAALFPPTRALLTVALWPAYVLIELITNH